MNGIFTGNLLFTEMAPGAVIIPSKVEEIVALVRFARDNGIHLTVKNGGHSYAGFSLNEGGIILHMRQFKKVEINDAGTEVTIQAGCIWNDVYDKFKGQNAAGIVVGGQCRTVGVSGFTLGGGFGAFSRSYGLGIDNVVEMTVVTAAGELLTLNHDETDPAKRDLFWALRGGGGGNLAILVEFKAKVHQLRDPHAKVVCGPLRWDLSNKEARDNFQAAMDVVDSREWPDELTIDALWRYKGEKLLGEMTMFFNGNMEKCLAVLEPILKLNPTVNELAEMPWYNWAVIAQGFSPDSPTYHHHISFILGQGAITPAVTKSIIQIMEDSHKFLDGQGKSRVMWHMGGGKIKDVAPDATPYYWREGAYVVEFKLQWTDRERNPEMLAFLDKVKKTLMPYALEGRASYLNYLATSIDDWQYAYYGDNYPRLQEVKAHWDPTNFFHFQQAIEPAGFVEKPTPILKRVTKKAAKTPMIIKRPTPGGPVFDSDSETERNAPAEDHRRPLTALERTAAMWNAYSFPDPERLWKLEDPNPHKVLMVMGEGVLGRKM